MLRSVMHFSYVAAGMDRKPVTRHSASVQYCSDKSPIAITISSSKTL